MNQPAPQQQPEALRQIPFMGVIHVVNEAMKLGYDAFDPNWSNLGQGMPEVGPLEGAPERYSNLTIAPEDHAYGPVEGLVELREAVADHYNRLYRQNKASKYTAENVVIAPGGRTALTRVGAAFSESKLGYFTPDYSAYEDLLNAFTRCQPVEMPLEGNNGFSINVETLGTTIDKKNLSSVLLSNPVNPTGHAVRGDDLAALAELARNKRTTLFMDEFYSHFAYDGNSPAESAISIAPYIDDVDEDPVFIFDGLTKCFRYPGWRIGWVVGPKDALKNVVAAGSFVDGGPSRPIQRAAIEVLEPSRADQETTAVRAEFSRKRNLMLKRLQDMGIVFHSIPESTFYMFGSTENLPSPINDGMKFFEEALKANVMTVPGTFFDVNPGKRTRDNSRLGHYVRFSYGPSYENISRGLDRLEAMIKSFG